jgi:hypothetical protein
VTAPVYRPHRHTSLASTQRTLRHVTVTPATSSAIWLRDEEEGPDFLRDRALDELPGGRQRHELHDVLRRA